jgi:amylosucrase
MQNVRHLTPEARPHFEAAAARARALLADEPARDRDLFLLRLERYFQNLFDGLEPIYGRRPEFAELIVSLVERLAQAASERPAPLRLLDIERDLTSDWFQRESVIGYVLYVERFAGTLAGVAERADHLERLGVGYLHLMSVLRPRDGESDGGYAVQDYLAVDPALGTVEDLEALCGELRGRGISVCIDLVLNHCAREHRWAERARAGDEDYRDYFYTFPDRTIPDRYEETLPEVFPDFAPGNFTFDPEMERWVWTTFNSFQWDLNWSNPRVFLEVVDIMLRLANRGVEVFRLDAVAFMWKRLGSDCQNQPEVHDLLQALRSCSRIATPAVAHKAEAIVSPGDLIHYFGTGKHYGKVSNIAYHNSLMVQFWSALASRDTRLMTHTLGAFPGTPTSIAWGTYLRCHDDIGWAVTDEDAGAVGIGGYAHRSFLSDFYAGEFEGSFARGAVFQHNPLTADRRISGSLASLAGLEAALQSGDRDEIARSQGRIALGHALICSFGGIPLLYMGDEHGQLNDHGYLGRPDERADNRWLHRPYMDWKAVERSGDPTTVEGRIRSDIQGILEVRRRTPHLHAAYPAVVLDCEHPHLFAFARPHPLGDLVAIFNFSERPQRMGAELLDRRGLVRPFDSLEGRFLEVDVAGFAMAPYQARWLI